MKNWTEDLATGIDEIDRQHRELFDAVNKLLDAAKQGRGAEEVKKTLNYLEGYVLDHFRAEEKYMDSYGYPQSERHKELHKDFLKEFLKLRDEFRKNEATSYLSMVIEGWLYNWLEEHFGVEDKVLGTFLKKKI